MKPKLISWIASRFGSAASPSRVKIRSRSSRSDRSRRVDDDVASLRTGSSRRRSAAIELAIPRWSDERVAVARLGEAPDQDLVAGLEEEHLRPDPAPLERAAHRPERHRRVAGADVEHDRDLVEPLRLVGDELRELGQELAGQVVDDRVAEVLEQLRRGGLAAAGEAAQDHDVLALARPAVGDDRVARRRPRRPVDAIRAPTARIGRSAGRRRGSAVRAVISGRSAGSRRPSARTGCTS